MSIAVLNYISDALESAGINYEFGRWDSDPVPDPYFVGEYTEPESMTEDGLQEATFLLTGFSRSTWAVLEGAKEKIEKLFSSNIRVLSSGSGVGIFYAGAMIVPTDDAELKRIQINLTIKEWKVN